MNPISEILFKDIELSDTAYHALSEGMQARSLGKKDFFLREGEVCRQLGLIVKGYLRLFFLKDGIEITKDFNFENNFCGSWASFSLQVPSRFNIIAMEDVELLTFSREQLFDWFERFPEVNKMARVNMERMFIYKEIRESSFLLDSAEERYFNLLEQFPGILQRVPLKYIASYLGLTAETISRIRGKKSL